MTACKRPHAHARVARPRDPHTHQFLNQRRVAPSPSPHHLYHCVPHSLDTRLHSSLLNKYLQPYARLSSLTNTIQHFITTHSSPLADAATFTPHLRTAQLDSNNEFGYLSFGLREISIGVLKLGAKLRQNYTCTTYKRTLLFCSVY